MARESGMRRIHTDDILSAAGRATGGVGGTAGWGGVFRLRGVAHSNYAEYSLMPTKTPITVAHGDGIGPEIMNATLQILEAAGAALEIETIEIGEKVYLRGNSAGIEPSSWESLLRTKVFLKAPITTPQGGGFKSLNVTTRKTLGQYANVRPCVSYHPFIDTKHPNMDVVIVRENEEDLRGHRVPADPGGHFLHQADFAAGEREDHPLRVRVRPPAQSQEGHVLHEGQHHEDDRRAIPQDLR